MKKLCISYASMVLLLLSLSACRTVCSIADDEWPERISHDTVTLVKNHVDSVYLRDSIYIHAVGDTIFQERWHTSYRYKYIYRDSIIVKTDSVPYPVHIVQKERYVPPSIQFFASIGAVAILALIIIAILEYLKQRK